MKGKEIFEGKWYAHPVMRNALIASIGTGIAFALVHLKIISESIEIAMYVISIGVGGYHWMWEGIEELIGEHEVGIEILMMAATIGSAMLGMWDEAAFLVVLYGAAEGLEEYTYAKTRASIRKLLDLAPKEARVIRDGEEMTIMADQLAVDDIFIVKPGETIATDGVIVKGSSSVNEAPVTGESLPVEKKEGMKVFAATMNQEGSLQIKVTAAFKDNTLSKMVHLVEEAQEQKSKSQVFIEKFGKWYSPAVLIISLLMIIISFMIGDSSSVWATRAIVLLVAAAPCALVMSTPVAIAAGIGKAGRSGVLIKGGAHLENLGKIKAVAFDKTGTLTMGQPVVTDVLSLNGDAAKLMNLAVNVENFSEHPLARAIVKKAAEMMVVPSGATDFSALPGAGARAQVEDTMAYVGKPDLFENFGLDLGNIPEILRLRDEGKTVVLVGTQKRINGIIAIRDQIRPQAKEVIKELHRKGIKTVMLTGDNAGTAAAIGKELGIDEWKADLKPEDKTQIIGQLERKYGPVAMVGDGINDAPALARASVGMAMGVAGSDAAIEAADAALMADDLAKVIYAIDLGKKVRKISLQNIVFSLLILAVLIPAALLGVMTIAMAVVFHEGSELLAVVNGLRVAQD